MSGRPGFVAFHDDLAKGIRRPNKMKAACERMDRMREENRKLFGEQTMAVDLIREARDHR